VASIRNQLAPEFGASVSPMVPMKNFDEIAQSRTTPEERDPGLLNVLTKKAVGLLHAPKKFPKVQLFGFVAGK
jgi:hypothetical protein